MQDNTEVVFYFKLIVSPFNYYFFTLSVRRSTCSNWNWCSPYRLESSLMNNLMAFFNINILVWNLFGGEKV